MDPISDFLTQIRNGIAARVKEISVPHSRVKFEIARVLLEEGFISNFRVEGEGTKKRIVISLKYLDDGGSVIRGLERVSKQSRRMYVGYRDLPRVMGGLGVAIISTPAGIITDREARRRKVGGEVICKVW
ncbi:MAG: 30S ribosomal protein S8 [candidate division WOR-3 bacterium]|nr:30S ribosomal protein S8 [candidate division WOR-3 bacterium]MDH7518744.1 30S ribosomal protein S8 [bacterium]